MKAEVITGNYAGASRRIKSCQNVHGSETGIYGSNCPQWIIAMEALLQALGERKGINRFGDFSPPLDEALIHVSLIIDLCNVREDVRRKAISIIDKFAERGLRSLDVGKQECQKKARRVQETRGSLSAYCLSLILQGMTVQKPLDGHSISE